MGRTDDRFHLVKRLADAGLSDYKIAALTGVKRAIVWRWRHRAHPRGTVVHSARAD
jgi:hypothetical protein